MATVITEFTAWWICDAAPWALQFQILAAFIAELCLVDVVKSTFRAFHFITAQYP
jgi:hypothetical protein